MGQIERLLVAETDYIAAQDFRKLAEHSVKLYEENLGLYRTAGEDIPDEALRALDSARLEYQQLNRVCLRHAARRLDAAKRAEGEESEMESAVIMFDISHPVTAAA